MADPDPIEEFSLERETDREMWVKHRASGHIYEFQYLDDLKWTNELTIVPNLSSTDDADVLVTAARRAAREYLRRRVAGPKDAEATDRAPLPLRHDIRLNQPRELIRRKSLYENLVAGVPVVPPEAGPPSGTAAIVPPQEQPPQSSGTATFRVSHDLQAGTGFFSVGSEPPAEPGSGEQPNIDAIPQQVTAASQFALDDAGRIDLIPDPPDRALLADPMQRELYGEIRHKANELSTLGHNQLGDLSTPIDRFRSALPDSIEAILITRLWSRGNTLRRRLHAHETAVAGSTEPDPARLPSLVAQMLGDLVETYNIFIVGDPKGRELDQIRLGPQDRVAAQAVLEAAAPIIAAVKASDGVATPAATEVLTEQGEAALDALSSSDVDSDQAIELGRRTSSNFIVALLRVAAWLRKARRRRREFQFGRLSVFADPGEALEERIAGGSASLNAASRPDGDILFQVLARIPASLSGSVLAMKSSR
jgi:hypothetical protein